MNKKPKYYTEETLKHRLSGIEVYGQDGYGWYMFSIDACDLPEKLRKMKRNKGMNDAFSHFENNVNRSFFLRNGFLAS